jgi:hypothetical protein
VFRECGDSLFFRDFLSIDKAGVVPGLSYLYLKRKATLVQEPPIKNTHEKLFNADYAFIGIANANIIYVFRIK